ncbi:MAG TPA: hypothetical protein VMM59_07220 [Thermohalobaculum sp.]|nr:hypothetical protein [Thermohalobaculum sp.]
MTHHHYRHPGYGFAAQIARADLTTFSRWYDRRCLLERPGLAECEASLSQPDEAAPEATPEAARPMRDAA